MSFIPAPFTKGKLSFPNADNAVVVNAVGMIIPVNGIAMRFVRMKYWGNVPKYNQARGPVVS